MKSHVSPKKLAEAVGVSESSVKRWVDAGRIGTSLTVGGHRRIPVAEAVRFIRETRADLVRPDALGLPEGEGPAAAAARHADRVLRLLEHGRAQEAVGLVYWLYATGSDVAGIVDDALTPAMERIGTLWLGRPDRGIYIEHRATQICIRALHELDTLIARPDAGAPIALGGAPADDPYILPSLAATIVLGGVGFATCNLGPDTPLEAFERSIADQHPTLVWLSLTSPLSTREVDAWIGRLDQAATEVGAALAVGGRESDRIGARHARNLFRGSSMAELAAFARGLGRSAAPGAH